MTAPRPAPEPSVKALYSRHVCNVFELDDSYLECDNCRRPLWHHMFIGAGENVRPIFSVRTWDPKLQAWMWSPVEAVITRETADQAMKDEGLL